MIQSSFLFVNNTILEDKMAKLTSSIGICFVSSKLYEIIWTRVGQTLKYFLRSNKMYVHVQVIWYMHCMKSVSIQSFSWSVFSCIQSEYRKIQTRKNSVFGHFSRSDDVRLLVNVDWLKKIFQCVAALFSKKLRKWIICRKAALKKIAWILILL